MSKGLKTSIILAGGRGMRLKPYTETHPKPLIEIYNRPIIDYIIDWQIKNGIEKIVIGIAYQKEKFFEWYANHPHKEKIVFSEHLVEDGTGGGFKKAIINGKIDDELFLAMNGDELTDLPLDPFFRFHKNQSDAKISILATPLYTNFGLVEINHNHQVTQFKEKPLIDGKFINSGVYIFSKDTYELLPDQGNIEQTTFVKLAEQGYLYAFRYYGFWRTVNTEKDLEQMKKEINILK